MNAFLPMWLLAALAIGFLGRHYRFGFWGYFLVSVLLTPLVGVVALIAAVPPRPKRF